ncbi:putative general amidase [Lyophyllum shimeji]|uniref:General amidase n=1 Tax=Lyophyllum shimeji TaxID=47721 RepID=A0A9P3PNP7_LYOSH|nr:putative general amidase [Lyophyllum shimeji]
MPASLIPRFDTCTNAPQGSLLTPPPRQRWVARIRATLAAGAHILLQLCLTPLRPRTGHTAYCRQCCHVGDSDDDPMRTCAVFGRLVPTPVPHILSPGPAATAIAAGRGGREYGGNGRGLARLTAQHPRVTRHGYDPPPNPRLPRRYPHPWPWAIPYPHPPVIRGLEMTKKALIAAGHKVIDWKQLDHATINRIALSIFGAGMAQDVQAVTSATGEPVISHMGLEQQLPLNAPVVAAARDGISAYDLWQLQTKKRDIRQKYLEHWLATTSQTGTGRPVDAIISPVAPYTAPPHGKYSNVNYTMVWNTLDYPALVIPVSKVDPVLDAKKPATAFLSDADEANYELYDPATFKGAPVAVQVVGRTHEDEAVIAMAEIVDAALKSHAADSPRTNL